jgi:hypothetical protein
LAHTKQKCRKIFKNIGDAKYTKTLAHPKTLAPGKNLADAKNLAHPKY